MGETQALGRFGHHPDPAIDFCVEVEEIEAIWTDRCLKVANPDDAGLEARVGAAMAFRVGGDLHAIKAKDRVRDIVATLDEELFALHDRMRAAAPDLYEALRFAGKALAVWLDDDEDTPDSNQGLADAMAEIDVALSKVSP